MYTVLFSLTVAVVLAIAYMAAVSFVDDATVGRRQLDAWTAIVAVLCALFITAGSADVRGEVKYAANAAVKTDGGLLSSERDVQFVRRSVRPSLFLQKTVSLDPAPASRPQPQAFPPPVVQVPDEMPTVTEVRPVYIVESTGQDRRLSEMTVINTESVEAVFAMELPRVVGGPSGWQEGDELALATPTPALLAVDDEAPAPLPPPVRIVPELPAPPPPIGGPPPSPTPHCGEPGAMVARVEVMEAEAVRGEDGELLVRYRARIANLSSFPVQLTNLRVTALNRRGGSEQFGVESRPDMSIPANDSLIVDGAIVLHKSPGPFGRTEVCMNMVPETCGRRLPVNQRIVGHCRIVAGYW